MNTKLKMTIRKVYGQTLIYPACKTSGILLQLTCRKTFMTTDLTNLEAVGFEIEWVADSHLMDQLNIELSKKENK